MKSCKVEVEDELSLNDLSQHMEEIFNQTQGKPTLLSRDNILVLVFIFEICSISSSLLYILLVRVFSSFT